MTAHIIVEGNSDKDVLSRLLADLRPEHSFEFIVGHGKDAARPIARKYLLRSSEPTVFVFDSDTSDPDFAREQLRTLEDYFAWHNSGVPFKLLQMNPALEVLFFQNPLPLQRKLNGTVNEALIRIARHAPRQTLRELLGSRDEDYQQFLNGLSPKDLAELRQSPEVEELRSFICQYA